MNLILTHLAVAGVSIALASVAIGLHLSAIRYRLEDRIYVLEDTLKKLYELDVFKPCSKGCYWKNEVARLLQEPETICDESLHDSDNRSTDDTVSKCHIAIKGQSPQ